MTKLRQVPDFRELKRGAYYYSEINLCFLILSCLIFESSVERGIPSIAAAPAGPATFPLLSARAVSIIFLSWFWRVSGKGPANSCRGGCTLASQAFSIPKVSPLHKITDLSIMFCNSRIFPCHAYDWHRPSEFFSPFSPRTVLRSTRPTSECLPSACAVEAHKSGKR